MRENAIQKTKFHYLIIIIALCGMMAGTYGLVMNCGNVFVYPVTHNVGIYQGSFAITFTITIFTNSFVSIYVIKLMREFNFKKIILSGAILLGLGTLFLAASKNIWMMYFASFIRGIGMAMYGTVPVLFLVNQWFEKHNGLVTSIVMVASGVTGAVMAPIFAHVIAEYGWRQGYVVMAIMNVVFSLLAVCYPFTMDPKEMNLSAYGAVKEEQKSIERMQLTKSKLVDFKFLVLFGIIIILTTAMQNLQMYFSSYAVDLGHSIEFGAQMISFCMIGNIVSKTIFGFLNDRWGSVPTSILMYFLNFLAVILLLFFNSREIIFLASALYGVVFSLAVVAMSLLTTYFFGKEQYEYIYPKLAFIASIFSSIMSVAAGYFYDFFGSLHPVMMVVILFQMISIIIILLLDYYKHKLEARNEHI